MTCALALLFASAAATASAPGDPGRGLYLAKAAGCIGCHTEDKKDAAPFAGGRALKTPFGTFYGPNITPHPAAGIGRWSEVDFVRAMREGVRKHGPVRAGLYSMLKDRHPPSGTTKGRR